MTADESTIDRAERIAREARAAVSRELDDEAADIPPAAPEYPVAALSVGPLGDLLRLGTGAGLPAPLVGAAGLGIGAACVMPAAVQVHPDRSTWVERPALWLALVAPPGGGKSPALDYARAPLDAIEDAEYEAWRMLRDEWAERPAKGRGAPPERRRWTIEDITPEMVMRALDQHGGRLTLVADELRSHLGSMGRYRTGGRADTDHALWLKIWNGKTATYDRVTGDVSIRVPRPVVPIVGGIQPAYVGMLGSDEDGSRARWLPHYSPDASIRADAPPEPAAWAEWVEQATANQSARTWLGDRATIAAWSDARDRWDALARATDSGPAMAGAAGKAPRQAQRVAVVLAEQIDPGRGGPLPPEAMAGAVALVDYTLSVWDVFNGSVGTLVTSRREEVLYGAADELAAWIEGRGGRVTYRDIGRARPARIRTAEQRDAVIAVYRQLYPHAVRDEAPPGGGKTATAVYAPRDPRIAGPTPAGVDMSPLSTPAHADSEIQPEPAPSAQVSAPDRPADGGLTVSTPPPVDIAMSTPDPTMNGRPGGRPSGWTDCAGCGHRVLRPTAGDPLCPECTKIRTAA